jgi:uncharacterized protein (TIGR02466 family)
MSSLSYQPLSLLFAFPVVHILPENNYEGADFVKLCLSEKEKDPTGLTKSNRKGWQGGYDFFKKEDGYKLFNHINSRIGEALGVLNVPIGKLSWLNSWINISPPEAYNTSHIHPGAKFSGVFYIQTPPNCGNIVFESCQHRALEMDMYDSQVQNALKVSHEWIYSPISGALFLFPSTLSHCVLPNESSEERISVSFNLG